MRRRWEMLVLSGAMLAPLVWLASTTRVGHRGGLWILGGACITAYVLLRMAWRAHFAGVLLPNRCRTCGHPMVRVRPDRIRPPEGKPAPRSPIWRCAHCGRMQGGVHGHERQPPRADR